ncbi:alpha-tocopherol transfer protein-like isoform X2 [Neocloeon triangulifer]|nr:alpha-tocopherol transfer protein-like isoform X2 [Neocloeon triangulifer]
MPPYNECNSIADVTDFSMELDLTDLTDELYQKAKEELGETPEIRADSLVKLRDMIRDKADIACQLDDDFLLRFLRARRFHTERSYKLLENYVNFKASRPDIHENVWPQRLKFLGDEDVISVPPYKDQHGRRMIIYKVGNWSTSKYKIVELFKASVVVMELGIMEKATTVLGGVCIFDLGGVGLSHVWNITPAVAETIIDMLVKCFPMRIHAIHIVFQPMVCQMMFAIFKPMLDKRMQDRIFFHGSDMASLHEHISPKRLPKKYGGIHENFNYRLWIDNLERNPKVMKALQQLGYQLEEGTRLD